MNQVNESVKIKPVVHKNFTATRNACMLCSPLGASLVFRGIEGAIPFLHGGQGCSTYIRRYLISHFREPMDIASSNFSESSTVFGGMQNFIKGVKNVIQQYHPSLLGIATTCLSETIGDNIPLFLDQLKKDKDLPSLPPIVWVSTPSYRGSHMEGFYAAVSSVIKVLARGGQSVPRINLFPGFVSPADIRYLKEIIENYEGKNILFPDYSETLDGMTWERYHKIPEGGTSIREIIQTGKSCASIEFGWTLLDKDSAALFLEEKYGVVAHRIPHPFGVRQTDRFFSVLSDVFGKKMPQKYQKERYRLIDSYIDGHKYVFGKKAILYGEEDFVIGISSFLSEVGIIPIIAASGGKSGKMREALKKVCLDHYSDIQILDGADFKEIEEAAEGTGADIVIGNSKGYSISRKLNIPLIRVGFPIHDRIGGQRVLHLGYKGAQELFDKITNALMDQKQENSQIGYSYL